MNKKNFWLTFVSMMMTLLMFMSLANASMKPLEIEIVNTIVLDKRPQCIAINEATNRIYVGLENGLLIIDGETDQTITEILSGVNVVAIAINPQTNRIFVANYGDDIFVLNGATNQQLGIIPDGIYDQYEIAINPNSNLVYIADWTTVLGSYDRILVYSGDTFAKVTQINILGSEEHTFIERIGLAVNPETNLLYAGWSGNNTLFVINGTNNEIIDSVLPSSFSEEIMINTYTNHIFIGDVVLDCETLIEVFSDYEGNLEAVDSMNNLVYTVGYSVWNDKLYVLNGTTFGIITSWDLDWRFASYSDCVGVNCETDKVYLVDNSESQIPVVLIPELSSIMLISTLIIVTITVVIVNRMKQKTIVALESIQCRGGSCNEKRKSNL